MEQPQNLTISAHDAFQAVTKYWGRINRPEQVMTDMISAMRVLTDTANTGAVAISLPQDVQAEAYDYPVDFFKKRVWRIDRRPITKYALEKAVEVIKTAKKPLLICGGGVRYAEAHKVFKKFARGLRHCVRRDAGGQERGRVDPRAEPRWSWHHRRHRSQQAGS